MFDAKEQAKYYIEKIKFLGKSTNQTLFIVFIPLFFLYLTEIEPRYILGENWITQKNQFHNLKYQSKIINNSLFQINDTISEINKLSVIKYPDSNARKLAIARIKSLLSNKHNGYFKQAKNKNDKTNTLKKKSYALYDSIKLSLVKLKIPITLPVLNVKLESFSFRFIVLLIMFFYTALLWNCYLKKQAIVDTLNKFVEIIKSKFSSTEESLYVDYDFNFPFWFFPIPQRKSISKEQRTLLKIIGIRKRNIPLANILIYGILLAFILINCRLVIINWNLNYKVFHSNYSILNTLSFCLFLLDITVLYFLLKPIIPYKITAPADIKFRYNKTRRDLIKLTLGLGICAIAEPAYSYFDNGKKWFQNPRHLKKERAPDTVFKMGLYIHKKRQKFRNIHYFNKHGKNSFLKTIAKKDLWNFQNNLKPISFLDLINSEKFLKIIDESNLVRYIHENKEGNDQNLKLLVAYLTATETLVSINIIELFTKLFANVRKDRPSGIYVESEKIKILINEFDENPNISEKDKLKVKNWRGRLKVL